jgi:hypothetical protein
MTNPTTTTTISLSTRVNRELDLQCMPITTAEGSREFRPVPGTSRTYEVTAAEAKGIASRATAAAEGFRDIGRCPALAQQLDEAAAEIMASFTDCPRCDHEAYDTDCDEYEIQPCCDLIVHVDDLAEHTDDCWTLADADDMEVVAASLRARLAR